MKQPVLSDVTLIKLPILISSAFCNMPNVVIVSCSFWLHVVPYVGCILTVLIRDDDIQLEILAGKESLHA